MTDSRRGPRSAAHSAAIKRGMLRSQFLRHQRDRAFARSEHVAIPTSVWLRRNERAPRRGEPWPEVECVPCCQRDAGFGWITFIRWPGVKGGPHREATQEEQQWFT